MGEDYHGNKFFEIPADPANGRRKTARYFEPQDKSDFEQEIPAEWEAWLRGRKVEPPSTEELMRNLAIMKLKQKNAALLEQTHAKDKDIKLVETPVKGFESYPSYGDEYETSAGSKRPKFK